MAAMANFLWPDYRSILGRMASSIYGSIDNAQGIHPMMTSGAAGAPTRRGN
jgi:hypothetical protein